MLLDASCGLYFYQISVEVPGSAVWLLCGILSSEFCYNGSSGSYFIIDNHDGYEFIQI